MLARIVTLHSSSGFMFLTFKATSRRAAHVTELCCFLLQAGVSGSFLIVIFNQEP